MTDNQQQQDGWDPCPPGTLGGMVQALRVQRRIRQLTQAGVVATSFAILLAVGFWSVQQLQPEPSYGGITCSEVRSHGRDYLMGQVSPELAQKIADHLKQCEPCRTLLEERKAMMQARGLRPEIQVRLTGFATARNSRSRPSWTAARIRSTRPRERQPSPRK